MSVIVIQDASLTGLCSSSRQQLLQNSFVTLWVLSKLRECDLVDFEEDDISLPVRTRMMFGDLNQSQTFDERTNTFTDRCKTASANGELIELEP